jgi:hypothetical protein
VRRGRRHGCRLDSLWQPRNERTGGNVGNYTSGHVDDGAVGDVATIVNGRSVGDHTGRRAGRHRNNAANK